MTVKGESSVIAVTFVFVLRVERGFRLMSAYFRSGAVRGEAQFPPNITCAIREDFQKIWLLPSLDLD